MQVNWPSLTGFSHLFSRAKELFGLEDHPQQTIKRDQVTLSGRSSATPASMTFTQLANRPVQKANEPLFGKIGHFISDLLGFKTPPPLGVKRSSVITNVQPKPMKGNSPTAQLYNLALKYGVKLPKGADMAKYQSQIIREVLAKKAKAMGIPAHIAVGMSGHESGWKMWSNIRTGALIAGRNGSQSTDWGAMQINDLAHPEAFPKAKRDLEFNLDYGLRYLKGQRSAYKGSLGLGLGDWDRTVSSYNLGHAPRGPVEMRIAGRYIGSIANHGKTI